MKTKIRKGIFIEINLGNPTYDSGILRIDFFYLIIPFNILKIIFI